MQVGEIDGVSQHGQGRVVEGFVSFGMAPASDGDVGEGGTVLGTDDSEEGVQGHGIFESERVAGIENGLGLGINGLIEKKDIRYEGAYREGQGDAS